MDVAITSRCSVHGGLIGDAQNHLKTGHALGDYVEVLDPTKTNRFVVLRGDFSLKEQYLFWTTAENYKTIAAGQKELAYQAMMREQSR